MDPFARAVAARVAQLEAVADVREPLPWGVAYRWSAHPVIWDHNIVCVTGPVDDPAARIDRLQQGLGHRKALVLDEAAADAVGPDLTAAGYEHDQLVALFRPGSAGALPDRPGVVVRPCSLAEVQQLGAAWLREELGDASGGIEAVLAAEPDLDRLLGPTVLGASPDGDDVVRAYCKVLPTSDPRTIELSDVYTDPSVRGQGLAAAIIGRALAAGRDAFLWADAEGDAVAFYRRLGFAPVGRVHEFLRAP